MLNPRNVALAAGITFIVFGIIFAIFYFILCATIGNNSIECVQFISSLTSGQILINIVTRLVIFSITGYVFAAVYNRLTLRS